MSSLDHSPAAKALSFYKRLCIGLGVIVVFLALIVVAQATSSESTPKTGSSADAEIKESPDKFASRDPEDPAALGELNAPVVLVQWTDLRCPFCAAVHRDALPAVIQEYVDEGLVRIEIRDVAFFGEQSEQASVAVRAAGRQGRYVEFLDAVYAGAPETGHPDLPRDKLIAFAEEAGVADMARFISDLDDPKLVAASRASTSEAQALGVNAVPFFVAHDVALSGAQPISVFRQFLDGALDQVK